MAVISPITFFLGAHQRPDTAISAPYSRVQDCSQSGNDFPLFFSPCIAILSVNNSWKLLAWTVSNVTLQSCCDRKKLKRINREVISNDDEYGAIFRTLRARSSCPDLMKGSVSKLRLRRRACPLVPTLHWQTPQENCAFTNPKLVGGFTNLICIGYRLLKKSRCPLSWPALLLP